MREKIKELRELVRRGSPWRELLLAYALVRGMPYHCVELTTRKPLHLAAIAKLAGQDETTVTAWVVVPPTMQMIEQMVVARRQFFDAKAERRARILADRAASLGIPA